MTDLDNDDNLENEEDDDLEDDNEEEFSYLDDDDDKMYTLFSKTTSIDKVKIDKVGDYYDLFVSMLKIDTSVYRVR